MLYPSVEEKQMRYMKGLSFDSEFVPIVLRIDRGGRASESHVDLISIEAKFVEVQDLQRSIVAAISDMKASFATQF